MQNFQSHRPTPSRGRLIGIALMAFCAMATVEPHLTAQTPVCPSPVGATIPSVLTGQYDNLRDAWNGNETCLYPASIGSGGNVTLAEASFSPLPVDPAPSGANAGYNPIYAQPLYLPGITVQNPVHGPCAPCNMVVIATAEGSIFAYNADNGNLLWSRTGTSGAQGTRWLWADDCGASGNVVGTITSSSTQYIGPGLPFAGIVSTPVIDNGPPTPYTYTMFVTSLCQTSGSNPQPEWWLHEIDLTGVTGTDVAGQDISTVQLSPTSGGISMNVSNQLQRPALLEVKNPNATPNPLILVAFGVAGVENVGSNPYHGWLLGCTVNSGGALVATPLNFVDTPTSCGTGGGTTACSTGATGNGGTPACDCLQPNGYQNAPNWGGMGGGIWMSGKGPASVTDSSNVTHMYVGTGNGGFQNSVPTGEHDNYGDSLLDFHLLPETNGLQVNPHDYFTPYGGPGDCSQTSTTNPCSPVIQPSLAATSCQYDTPGDGTCNHTVELYNEYDWDMGTSGITLFNYGTTTYIVTVDKGGYGYLLVEDDMQGFDAGDPGNKFPFEAVDTVCTGEAHTCHRTTSLAFYNNTLYLWPYAEDLKALQFNGSLTAVPASGLIYTNGAGTAVTGSGFSGQVVPGDWLISNGCTPPACPIVTLVNSNTEVTVSPAFSPPIAEPGLSYSYNGYFLNPQRNTVPAGSPPPIGYPGGELVVTSNQTTANTGVVWGLYAGTSSTEGHPGLGFVDAYNATNLHFVWSTYSLSGFYLSRFAMPTVVNGSLFVPTYYITKSQANSSCTTLRTLLPPQIQARASVFWCTRARLINGDGGASAEVPAAPQFRVLH